MGLLSSLFTLLGLYSILNTFPFLVESATSSIDTDKEALLSFKSELSYNPTNSLSSWDQNISPCNWSGVACNTEFDQRVIGLDLAGLRLKGKISPHIGNLTSLRSLQLQENELEGPLPDNIGNLVLLILLNVSSNTIKGILPPNITRLTQLQILDMTSNNITGRIPQNISSLTKLQVLKLGQNHLYGPLPPSIGDLTSLTNINFGTNSLSGAIPNEIGRLKNLSSLDLTINNLNGTIPPSIYNLTSLVNFAVASNNLWGEIPYDVGEKLLNLLVFNFCFNKFTGRIPGSLHNLTNIQVIRMAHNLLEGVVPPGLGNLPFLRMYNIGFNKIVSSGDNGLDFITSLSNSSHLEFLAIDGNQLEGVIPESIGSLSKALSKLYMGGNRIYGNIPTSISRLSGLSLLNLSYNSISGQIPSELGQLKELQSLSLAGNQISGRIPNSLGNLQKLNRIDLSRNQLIGTIPPSFGNFQKLLSMDLSNNMLNRNIPIEVLNLPSLSSFLDLSNNILSGSIPLEVGLLTSVVEINLSDNLLSGNIPNTTQGCRSLEKLFLARNMLSGPIPSDIGKLRGLEALDLSSNRLSGSIPVELENLQALKLLNLSYNNLEGVVPDGGVFISTSSVHLEGNEKLCLSFECSKTRGSRRLAVVFVIVASVVLVALTCIICLLLYIRASKRRLDKKEPSEVLKQNHQTVSYIELRRATENFDEKNMIGSGGFGSVYKGYLSLRQGMTIAVKVLDTARTGSLKSFLAECEALRNLRHRNLVKLITSCSSIDSNNIEFRALVYEFLSNGSLEDWIKGKRKHSDGQGLNLMERLNVAIDVACALDYLHNESETPVVHCDLKPSNTLLDQDMTAKVGDFGLARMLMERTSLQISISSTHVLKGSIGYIPPEYGWGKKPSVAGDMYSFGVMLLELFCGKSPTDKNFTEGFSLTRWVQVAFPANAMQVLDIELLQSSDGNAISQDSQVECLVRVLEIGLSCAGDSAEHRISASDALGKLKTARDALLKSTLKNT